MEKQLPEEELQEEQEFEVQFIDDVECIQAAYFAISTIDDIDLELASPSMRQRVMRIKRNSIKIVDHCLKNLYNTLFETDED